MKYNRFNMILRKEAGEGEGGTGGDFQAKVLDGIGKVREQFNVIEGKFTELDKNAKKTAEEFDKHVKSFEGLPSQVADVTRTLAQMQLKISQERQSNYGTGVERILADDKSKKALNGLIRINANMQGFGCEIPDEQRKLGEELKRALSGGASPGSTWINAQLLPDIYSTIAEYGIWRNFDVVPVSTSSAKLIVDSADPVMYFTAENTAATEGAPTGSNVTATIAKALGWIQVSRELLEDAEIDVAGNLLRKFANATAYRMDWACTSADGGADATDGGFTGIFGGSGTAAVAASGNVSVATLDFEDWLAALLAVDPAVLSRPTARWFIHPQMLVRALAIKDSNGRPIFLSAVEAPAAGAIGSILGYPVVLTHAGNATDGVSKKIAVFGDAMGQSVCLRQDFEFAASDQAKFTEDSVVFRARARFAAKTKVATAFGVLTTAAS
jgi:HK97 family phage major capsid protein